MEGGWGKGSVVMREQSVVGLRRGESTWLVKDESGCGRECRSQSGECTTGGASESCRYFKT